MLVGVQCAWVDVDVGIELLDGDLITTRQQQFTDTGGDDSLA